MFDASEDVATARYVANRGIHRGHALLKCSLNNCRRDSADFQHTHKLMPERSTILGSACLQNAFLYQESVVFMRNGKEQSVSVTLIAIIQELKVFEETFVANVAREGMRF